MGYARFNDYLEPVIDELAKRHPDNHVVNIVCHGHSVPAGYFATPFVDTFNSYPHLLHVIIKERFPFAVVNVIVTGKGGENCVRSAERFTAEVLNHNPAVVTINSGFHSVLGGISPEEARAAWEKMIAEGLGRGVKLILMTPIWDQSFFKQDDNWKERAVQAEYIRELAAKYGLGIVDTYKLYEDYVKKDDDLTALLSHVNHPSRLAHEMIARELARYFVAR